MMQIRELVLYGRDGKVRELPFSLGTVNILLENQNRENLLLVILLITVWVDHLVILPMV